MDMKQVHSSTQDSDNLKDKKSKKNSLIKVIAFILVFFLISGILTNMYIPYFSDDARLAPGFYKEEKNSMDVILLGSCNMYTTFSPAIAYERKGLTSYVMGCPDQEMVMSYHYLVDALKTQKPKVVVVEALFLTHCPTPKREFYNRTALEYMPMSVNKAKAILEVGKQEHEYMKTINPNTPSQLLTYAGYFFPLLRYHGREDIEFADGFEDKVYEDHGYYYKGCNPLRSYINNETLDFAEINNQDEIRDTAREYFEKIRDLCEKENIKLVLLRSPNPWRWTPKQIKVIKEFAKEEKVDYVDGADFGNFVLEDYSDTTGRLNVYGMKMFTEKFTDYIIDKYKIKPRKLTKSNEANWDACVKYINKYCNLADMPITDGTLYKIQNEKNGIKIFWNRYDDCTRYGIYRKGEKSNDFQKIDTVSGENRYYVDKNVEPMEKYTYYVMAEDGKNAGKHVNERSYVFINPPESFEVRREGKKVKLTWLDPAGINSYSLDGKEIADISYEAMTELDSPQYIDENKRKDGYDYRVRCMIQRGDKTYYSAAAVNTIR